MIPASAYSASRANSWYSLPWECRRSRGQGLPPPYWPVRDLAVRNIKTSANTQASMLGVPGKLAIPARANTVTIRLPELNVDTVPCQHVYAFKITESVLLE
jgi:Alpha-L-fucosidase C-terminal domain